MELSSVAACWKLESSTTVVAGFLSASAVKQHHFIITVLNIVGKVH
jgi:hypothetical protein